MVSFPKLCKERRSALFTVNSIHSIPCFWYVCRVCGELLKKVIDCLEQGCEGSVAPNSVIFSLFWELGKDIRNGLVSSREIFRICRTPQAYIYHDIAACPQLQDNEKGKNHLTIRVRQR